MLPRSKESPTLDGRPRPVWREWELLVVVLLAAALYLPRLTTLTIRGEESRWARVAQEMIETGDWIVPRQQGQPFPDRPPLNSWAMIGASQFTGEMNLVAVRLPAAMATLLTSAAIYLYGRKFLSRVGALAAGVAYPTMAQVLQLGRLAETDSLLTLLVAASLFTWHAAYACYANPRLAWCAGYSLAALAGLAKGPQGPLYFVAASVAWLSLRRDWTFLFNRWHAVGLAFFVVIIGTWQVPFMMTVGVASSEGVWSEGGAILERLHYSDFTRAIVHWLSYPFAVFASMMPWSFMLPVLASRWFRSHIGTARPMVGFLLTACVVAFPTCWLPAESRPRYFMSLYPAIALLCGAVIERCCESTANGWWPRSWTRFLQWGLWMTAAATIVVAAAGAIGIPPLQKLADVLSPLLTWLIVVAGTATVAAFAWSLKTQATQRAQMGVVAVAGFWGLIYTGIVLEFQARAGNDAAPEVARVSAMVPADETLVSFRAVHHLFAYHYRRPIQLREAVCGRAPHEFEGTYFCFAEDPTMPKLDIPFAWEQLAEISCERRRAKDALTKVVVGRRISRLGDIRTQSAAAHLR